MNDEGWLEALMDAATVEWVHILLLLLMQVWKLHFAFRNGIIAMLKKHTAKDFLCKHVFLIERVQKVK